MERRAYLAGLGAAAGGLAGCLDGNGSPGTDAPGGAETDEGTAGPATDGGTDDGSTTHDGPATDGGGCGSGARLENASFECGTYAWTVSRDLPTDPNTGDPVATNVAVTGFGRADPPPRVPAAADGEHALELTVDGLQDDGTLWVQQPADLSGCSTLSVAVHSPEESFNTLSKVAAYAGPARELTEADFDTAVAVEDHVGWETVEYPIDHDGEGLVAVGISVVWETEVRRYLDAVRVS